MFTKLSEKIGISFLLGTLLTGILAGATVDSDSQDPNSVSSDSQDPNSVSSDYQDPKSVSEYFQHKELYDILKLRKGATDSEIIQLLDVPYKRTFAIALIRYRKISSAMPKLLDIIHNVSDNNMIIIDKISAAEALCDFGNKEWIPIIKALSTDPNGFISRTHYKFDVAGLLARAGDYSQFKVVAKGISDSRDYIRFIAIYQLRNFGHKTNPVTDSAVGLLTTVCTSDPIPWLRECAIESLEKIARTKPEVTSKVIAALEANKDSSDKSLRIKCRVMLEHYTKKPKKK